MVDDGLASRNPRGDFPGESPFMLARHRTPQQDRATSHHYANFGRVHFATAAHLVLNARTQINVGWGDLAGRETLI